MPVLDDFLLQYNVGQVLLFAWVLVTLASVPLRSRKLLAINTILFGVLFVVSPFSLVPTHYKYLGLALLVFGPMLYTTASR